MRSAVVLALFATGCQRAHVDVRDAANDWIAVSDATTDASFVVTAVDAALASDAALPIPGFRSPARRVASSDVGTPTTREAFLAAHGVATDKPDAACFSGRTHLCTCDRAITIDARDVLVCKRYIDGAADSYVHIVTRSVFYVADHGALKVVLAVPTAASVEAEDMEAGPIVGNVSLRAIPSPRGVTFVDEWETDAGPWCPQAVTRAAQQRGKTWPATRRAYAEVCASAGRYVFEGGRLVKGG